MSDHRPTVFGEVLFDHFPDGSRVLGGAPFNVAWHLQAFEQSPVFISRVGTDQEGEQIRDAMRDWGMETNGLQSDPDLSSGRVAVSFDNGEPSYEIVQPCAYDAIEPPDARNWRLLYHGSLAVRGQHSMRALQHLLGQGNGPVFLDVNLRPPWWNIETLRPLLRSADWVKLNGDELAQLQSDGDTQQNAAAAFLHQHQLQGLILTHGADGAEAFTRNGEHHRVHPDAHSAVVDTVGAGDAFASVVIVGLLNDWSLPLTLDRAQAFASRIVGQRGATIADPSFYRDVIDSWHAAD